jgi:hypothetical protein
MQQQMSRIMKLKVFEISLPDEQPLKATVLVFIWSCYHPFKALKHPSLTFILCQGENELTTKLQKI